MFDKLKFMVIEDVEPQRMEVLRQLASAGFKGENQVAQPRTYQEAVDAIADHAVDLDVVFLDLRLPRDQTDGRPEKGHGRNLLKLIHDAYNPGAGIRVVVVSGEDLLDGFTDQNMYDAWPGTLVSIAQKGALATTMKASLRRLKRDPLAQHIRRVGEADLLALYEQATDSSSPIGERLKAARGVGLHLVKNEVDWFRRRVGYADQYGDNLNGLIKDEIEVRFEPTEFRDGRQKRLIKIGKIASDGGWGAFLWRGSTIEHLYTLNGYRNLYQHGEEQPYNHPGTNSWSIPRSVLDSVEDGRLVGVVVESIVRDLLQWYLPWHEQVYKPWREGQR